MKAISLILKIHVHLLINTKEYIIKVLDLISELRKSQGSRVIL